MFLPLCNDVGQFIVYFFLTFSSLAPYERRIIELLRNAKDKRARKLAKKKVRNNSKTHLSEPQLTSFSWAPSAVPRLRSRT